MHLMITCINTVLIPLAASNITVRRGMEHTTSSAISRMEDKVNSIMQRTIDVALTWVSKLLSGQKKSDFKPRDDALGDGGSWLELLQTPVCHRPRYISIDMTLTNLYASLTQDLSLHLHIPHSCSQPRAYRPGSVPELDRLPYRTRLRLPRSTPRPFQEIPSQRSWWYHGDERPYQIH